VTFNAGTDVSGTGLLHIANGTVTANAPDTIPNLKLDSGTLNGAGRVSVNHLLWDGGSMSGPARHHPRRRHRTWPPSAQEPAARVRDSERRHGQRHRTGTVNMGASSSIQTTAPRSDRRISFNDSGSAATSPTPARSARTTPARRTPVWHRPQQQHRLGLDRHPERRARSR
jgi:hypothetical protein